LAYGMPFISGKDSLNNEYHSGDRHIVIPPTLLISALGRVPDVRHCVTMDLKEPGNLLGLIGVTWNEMGGSHYNLVHQVEEGTAPKVILEWAPRIFQKLHEAIRRGLIRSCHDLSEGGLALAIAEMCIAGGLGANVERQFAEASDLEPEVWLFAESNTRFLLEYRRENAIELASLFDVLPCQLIGTVIYEPVLTISCTATDKDTISAPIAELKEAWQKPLRW